VKVLRFDTNLSQFSNQTTNNFKVKTFTKQRIALSEMLV
jgi:hypothetical protein